VSKRIVASVLVVMLGITALLGGESSFLNSFGLLSLLWPLSMIALASYWLRLVLAERVDFEYGAELKVRSHLSSSGLYLVPFAFARS